MTSTFAREIRRGTIYTARIDEQDSEARIRLFNKIIAPIRITVRRIKLTENPGTRFDDFVPEIWDGIEVDDTQSNEETDDHGFLSLISYSHMANDGTGGYTGYIDSRDD